MNEELV